MLSSFEIQFMDRQIEKMKVRCLFTEYSHETQKVKSDVITEGKLYDIIMCNHRTDHVMIKNDIGEDNYYPMYCFELVFNEE